ncbi:V-type proton ATPase subunit E-like [Rhodnius prolixus]|uniref:V-type proton ATPase subunit E-like n=1 Tax=Rhodnius prolixus TaxID=13249 RepID=UPI003D18C9E9
MDFSRQVERMIAFMDKEGEERRKEMFEKADEEYNIQIGYMLRTERAKLSNWYKKKEDAVVMSRKVAGSVARNEARLSLLRYRVLLVDNLYKEIRDTVLNNINDINKRRTILGDLLFQGLCMMVEKRVGLRVCKQDVSTIKGILATVQKDYEKLSTLTVDIVLDDKNYLSDDKLLGVFLSARRGRISVENTIASRIEQIRTTFAPGLRKILFRRVTLSMVTRYHYK